MADKIQRRTQKIFAGNAATDSLAVFGSMITGNPIYTDNIEDLQSNAYQEGWASAIAANEAPFLEEMNGVQYGLSKQIAYTLQTGIPEWDANTEYFANTSFCQVNGVWYQSLTDNNIGNNPTEDTTNWREVSFGGGGTSGLEIGDIGFALAVDEAKGTRRILNGSILAINPQVEGFVNWLKALQSTNPEYFKTEEEWQAAKTLSPDGIVNAFVLDETAGTIRLMSYPDYFAAGLSIGGTAPVKGNGMNIGLIMGDGKNTSLFAQSTTLPAYYDPGYGQNLSNYTGVATGHTGTIGLTKDSSKSGMVADLSGLSTEKIKGVYFIQINSGTVETDKPIHNYTVNNPYSYGMFQYLPEETNNPSWLKSVSTYYAKAIYPDLYNWIRASYNSGKEGFKASTASDITDYDWVINTTDETFRFPLKTSDIQTPQGWALYFYCGDALQNVDLMNVARIEEKITDINSPSRGYLVDSYVNGASWYRVYSDGWCEQGGYSTGSGASVTFLKKMANTNYMFCFGGNSTNWSNAAHSFTAYNITVSGFNIKMEENSTLAAGMNAKWMVCGYVE